MMIGGFTVLGVLVIVFFIAPIIQSIARGPQWLQQSMASTLADEATSLTTSKKVLIAENNKLNQQVQNDQASLLELKTLEQENNDLKTELSYLPNPQTVMVAGVLAKPSDSLYNSLIIDQGSQDGVSVGQLVTAQGTIGLGTISSVSKTTATVQLFSGPQFNGDLVMKGQKITVPATGKGSGNFEIHIPHNINVVTGDTLAFPDSPNVIVGIIESVIFDPRDPFQTVLARTPVNIQELQFVEVVK